MKPKDKSASSIPFLWLLVSAAIIIPLGIATTSPLLEWREPVYIISGFAGILAMSLMLLQPLLMARKAMGLSARKAGQFHLWSGMALVSLIVIHVGGLWITTPPDVIDALLFASPTQFSVWGVVAMWAIFAAAFLASTWRIFNFNPKGWRMAHTLLVSVCVIGTVVHAYLIEGTMETVSKVILCALVLVATAKAVFDRKRWVK